MSQTPPEIEALIWSIAESGDPQAISEFETRFPEHRLELLKRLNAVQELRKAKGKVPGQPPVFIPTPQPPFLVRFGRIGFATAALAGFAVASYWLAGNLLGPKVEILPPHPPVNLSMGGTRGETPKAGGPVGSRGIFEDEGTKTTLPVTPSPIPPTRLPTPSERPMTLHIQRANLLIILDGLAAQAGWTLEVAPGTPDPEVRVDYDQVPVGQILQDMGRRFGFTAFDEGNNKILIVPARDGTGPYKVDPKSQNSGDEGDSEKPNPGQNQGSGGSLDPIG